MREESVIIVRQATISDLDLSVPLFDAYRGRPPESAPDTGIACPGFPRELSVRDRSTCDADGGAQVRTHGLSKGFRL